MGVRQCLPSSRRVCQETRGVTVSIQEKTTTPTRWSSSTYAPKETPQTQDLHDPDGTSPGLSQHCPASVFSSQTIHLQFGGGTRPSQQTESGPMAIKGPCPRLDEHLVHHERDETPNAHQRSDQRVSQQCQQQFQGPTARTAVVTGHGVACRVDVPDRPGSRTEQCRHRHGSSYQRHPIQCDVRDAQIYQRGLSRGHFQDQGVLCGIERHHEYQTSCDLREPVLATSDARSAQHDHGETDVRTRLCQDL